MIGTGRRTFGRKGGRHGDVSRGPLKMRWFPVFVYARKPVAAIRGLRHARGIKNFKNSGISRGGLVYTGGVWKAKTEIPVKRARRFLGLA